MIVKINKVKVFQPIEWGKNRDVRFFLCNEVPMMEGIKILYDYVHGKIHVWDPQRENWFMFCDTNVEQMVPDQEDYFDKMEYLVKDLNEKGNGSDVRAFKVRKGKRLGRPPKKSQQAS